MKFTREWDLCPQWKPCSQVVANTSGGDLSLGDDEKERNGLTARNGEV
jgi:hypothetical protein